MTLLLSRPKRDLLLYVARHTAVTLTRNAPLSKAQSPGLSVSANEPSGVFVFSWFCQSSSRSLGRCLLLGQRSRLNFFSDYIRSLLHQDHRDPHTEFSCHRNNRDSGSYIARMGPANRAKKLSELSVLSDRRPGGLDQLTSQPSVPAVGDRPAFGSISGRVLGRSQSQKPCQLADVFKLSPIADPGQELAGHNPANPRNRHQALNTLGQFGIFPTEPTDLSSSFKSLLFRKLHALQKLIELKTHAPRTLKLSKLCPHSQRPLPPAGRCRWKANPFKEQQRFDALLACDHLAHKGVTQLGEVAKLTIDFGGT